MISGSSLSAHDLIICLMDASSIQPKSFMTNQMGRIIVSQQNDLAKDGSADFDFFMGSWLIQNRRLREQLKGSTEWEEFGGTTNAHKILGGLGHIEEFSYVRPSGPSEGLAIRLFDHQTQQWSVYGGNSRSGLDPHPAIGTFRGGRFVGYSHEPWEGQYIFCRVIWSEITATSFRWEQAFSNDGGQSWEVNWVSTFARSS
jgi:hypothetical protein